jgi:tRNA pseudouridine55 synthase
MAKRRPPQVHGLVLIDKPAGVTSHDVVNTLRKSLSERRIGHAGTLDPDATGVLVVAVGRATRLMQFVSGADKEYVAEVVLGARTSTLDDSGEVLETFNMGAVTPAEVQRVVSEHLVGDILQVPPMVSALKVDGKRLHEYAREGVEIERKARPVHISRFDIEATDDPLVYRMSVECSSGTYVRTLADDLGRLLGGGAHLRRLRRTRVGRFTEQMTSTLESPQLLSEVGLVEHLVRVDLDAETADRALHGAMLPVDVALGWVGDGPWSVYGPNDVLLGVYEPTASQTGLGLTLAKPTVVIAFSG